MCRVCEVAAREGRQAKAHGGSFKSMESNVAVELFHHATTDGIQYSTYVGDWDSTTESQLKTIINYGIEKWSDIDHSSEERLT